jgi:hypothetical protein
MLMSICCCKVHGIRLGGYLHWVFWTNDSEELTSTLLTRLGLGTPRRVREKKQNGTQTMPKCKVVMVQNWSTTCTCMRNVAEPSPYVRLPCMAAQRRTASTWCIRDNAPKRSV